MFQTVKKFQSRSVKAGSNSSSLSTSRSLRDSLRVAGVVSMPGGAAISKVKVRGAVSNNDVQHPGCWALTKEHFRRELWSYLGLLGLLSIYFGILVCVYAVKGAFAQRGVMTFCGVLLNGVGGVNLFVSWMRYRCQRKHRRFGGGLCCCCCCCCCGDSGQGGAPPSPKPPKSRPRSHSLAGFLTPEFAKYAEFSARDRRYDNRRHHHHHHHHHHGHILKAYDPSHISISFAHRYWLEQQKPLLSQTGFGNPGTLFPSSFPASPRNLRTLRSTETKRRLLDATDDISPRRQLST
ncbi:uncharacterized protein LOC143294689 [Babylonia areolata]|uniref:uncharacterized protein LOC143294689 n=1 Tax=Babylonia areolata TaxID=304850 RepID=UPI003FD316D0